MGNLSTEYKKNPVCEAFPRKSAQSWQSRWAHGTSRMPLPDCALAVEVRAASERPRPLERPARLPLTALEEIAREVVRIEMRKKNRKKNSALPIAPLPEES